MGFTIFLYIILKSFRLKTKNSADYYIREVSSGKRNFDDYLLTGYKI